MNLLNTTLQRAKALADKARSFVPDQLMTWATDGTREWARAAFAGAILFGIAGAGLGARGGFSAFRIDSAAAGATVSVGWGYLWLALAAAGAAAGAGVGAGVAYATRQWLGQGLATSLLMIGALGGVAAGATWGSAVARERVVEVRAQQANARPPAPAGAPRVTVVNGPVRLDGTVDREMNLPLLAFIVLGATVVGTLAARGLVEPLHPGRRAEQPAPRAVPLPGGFPLA